jgi:hypothetical protein
LRGKSNEPANVKIFAQNIAIIKGITLNEVISENAKVLENITQSMPIVPIVPIAQGLDQSKSSAAASFSQRLQRDKRFNNANRAVDFTNSSFGKTPQLRFTIDGNKLSNKFKVQPYSQGGRFDKGKKDFESEERVTSDKLFTIPLSNYLISIDLLFEYKKPEDGDWDAEFDYEEYAPLRAEIIQFAQDKNLPINLIVNKNGDPWPDKVKDSLIQKILNWFKGK